MAKYEPSKMTRFLNSTRLKMKKGLSFEEAVEKARVPEYCRQAIKYLLEEIEKGNLQI